MLFQLFLGIPTSQAKLLYKFTISHVSKIPLYHTSLLTPLNPSGYHLYHQAPQKTKLLSANRMYCKLDFCLTVHHQLGKIIQMNQLDATMIY